MALKKKKNSKKYAGTELEAGYVPGNDANLFLDKPFMALSNLSKKKKGKEVPVNIQISDYLKSMKLIESSVATLEEKVEKSEYFLKSGFMNESRIIKKRINGKIYSTTRRMIEAVRAFDMGRISKKDLEIESSWARDPEAAVKIARIIGRDKWDLNPILIKLKY